MSYATTSYHSSSSQMLAAPEYIRVERHPAYHSSWSVALAHKLIPRIGETWVNEGSTVSVVVHVEHLYRQMVSEE